MNGQVQELLTKFPGEIISLFEEIRQLIFESASNPPEETLWEKCPATT